MLIGLYQVRVVYRRLFIDDNYSCSWKLDNVQPTFGGFDASRELCSFTQALPQAGGLYTYSISVSPPATTAFFKELTLVEPGDITTSCPQEVARGGDLSCTCQTTNTASPPATVRWEGRDSEKLVKTNVQREDNGTQFTCHVTWAGRVYTSITYTLLVKPVEGPTDVVINADTYPGSNGSRVVLLSCKAQAPLYPGANFTWSGTVCHNETHTVSTSTCTIMFGAQDDGKSVTCTAINSINSGISTSTTVMLRINGTGFIEIVLLTPSTTTSTGAIVGAVVAVLCIAVIICVIVVFIRRQRHVIFIAFSISVFIRPQKPNLKKAQEETAQSEGEIYENFSFNDPTKVCTTQQTSSVKEGQNQSNVYENTHIQPVHIYDTTCTTYEQHKYADLTVKATPDVKVSEYEVPERKEGVVYSNA
ncbi:uncharacterized protein LOC112568990 [Pomacea canaliculata]|uniref:uncharacterized protein LOC112568990 n=1 Tax=Pomacea canaliculata TaxID=400727 RepID=UPI000D72C906|nr:uncharacterized protein LOC112568990 [Pomacea canaliculata]XP_025102400.1 uncharacterized protein LOC112568990 [Pomacea canaliculata]XP_025102401.1 uncharacterized protein LOC112568990 [Pomacea canaliculata]XP_025102402.1 uncharacterized protein LOC112568990 [Pomacea canaliculata]